MYFISYWCIQTWVHLKIDKIMLKLSTAEWICMINWRQMSQIFITIIYCFQRKTKIWINIITSIYIKRWKYINTCFYWVSHPFVFLDYFYLTYKQARNQPLHCVKYRWREKLHQHEMQFLLCQNLHMKNVFCKGKEVILEKHKCKLTMTW